METANWARTVERLFFGALLGALAAALVARFVLLAADVPLAVLTAAVLIGAAGGVFVTHYGRRNADLVAQSFEAWNEHIRQFSLKVMLWMLALAAVIGVLTVLTASYNTLGRLAGTVVLTGVAAGLLWPLSTMADTRKAFAAGLLGMAATVVVYLMVVPLIWDFDPSSEEMIVSSLVLGLTTPFGMMFLCLMNLRPMWIAGRFGVAAWVGVLSLFLIAVWHPGGYRDSSNWWETGWVCALYGGLAVACLAGLERMRADWRWLGVLAAGAGWMLMMIGIWGDANGPEELLIVITSLPAVLGHAALAMLTPLKPHQSWLRWGTIAAMAVGAAFFDLEVVLDSPGISICGRVAGAGGIVASCGSLALIILASLNRTKPAPVKSDFADITSVSLTCPHCRLEQSLQLGTTACRRCGLVFRIQVELPAEQGESPFHSQPNEDASASAAGEGPPDAHGNPPRRRDN